MESKYALMGTGLKVQPVGGFVLQGRHLEVRHIESRLIFLHGNVLTLTIIHLRQKEPQKYISHKILAQNNISHDHLKKSIDIQCGVHPV